MIDFKYGDELTEKDWEIIKNKNPKIYETLQKRKNNRTFSELAVFFSEDSDGVFFDYIY